MKINEKMTVTSVKGFFAAGINCGIRKSKKDLSIIFCKEDCIAAGTFTKNLVKAAPVKFSAKQIENEASKAIIINSGNANACTGEMGYKNTISIAKETANRLNIDISKVLVASTGIIGKQLPMDKILPGIEKITSKLSKNGGVDAADGILTTDTFSKFGGLSFEIDGKKISMAGIAKGSGMIHPNMGTMLSFITTDISIEKSLLKELLKESVSCTYNMISVDGDTSTNDSVIILANGLGKNKKITEKNDDYYKFKTALNKLNEYLAKKIAQDGEGATKLIQVELKNAHSLIDAKKCAKSVITSTLVKSAFFGNDANWGRILCSLGYSKSNFDPKKIEIHLQNKSNSIKIVENGVGLKFCEDTAKTIIDSSFVNIAVDLNDGVHGAKAWGCDLSYDYVKINGSYRS